MSKRRWGNCNTHSKLCSLYSELYSSLRLNISYLPNLVVLYVLEWAWFSFPELRFEILCIKSYRFFSCLWYWMKSQSIALSLHYLLIIFNHGSFKSFSEFHIVRPNKTEHPTTTTCNLSHAISRIMGLTTTVIIGNVLLNEMCLAWWISVYTLFRFDHDLFMLGQVIFLFIWPCCLTIQTWIYTVSVPGCVFLWC